DAVGNMLQIEHVAGIGGWTRHLKTRNDSNRLETSWDGSVGVPIPYQYDTHGNMLNLAVTPPDQYLRWDHRDMIASLYLVGGGWASYSYDSGKRRTRKRLVRPAGSGGVEDRIYLEGYELYR